MDGKCLLIGKELDGFRLVSVRRNSALLECEESTVELKIVPDPELPELNQLLLPTSDLTRIHRP